MEEKILGICLIGIGVYLFIKKRKTECTCFNEDVDVPDCVSEWLENP